MTKTVVKIIWNHIYCVLTYTVNEDIIIYVVVNKVRKRVSDMGTKRDRSRLTDLELTVMRVLWESEVPMTIQQIATALKEEKRSVQSVTQVISRLVKRQAVTVSGLVLISNVYARSFSPVLTQQEVLEMEIRHLQEGLLRWDQSTTIEVIEALINDEEGDMDLEDLEELQRALAEWKQKE